MKKLFVLIICFCAVSSVRAQVIDLENFDLKQMFGKVLTVKKGYAPKFYLGKSKIGSLDVVAKVLGSKNNPDINRLFKTFKTGRTVYRVAAYTGTALAVYGTVKNAIVLSKDSVSATSKNAAANALYSGLGTFVSGVVVKALTKGASYKAVDLFGGVIKKKLGDIINFDLGMAPSYQGTPVMTAGFKIAL